ncbi:MAG: RICIN domain-containing protein [Micromonosporaceae bacterium]|nr:RICIN domain-containing protein [Micromonosporaceae bacterium]
MSLRSGWARVALFTMVMVLGAGTTYLFAGSAEAATVSIANGTQFKDTAGNILHAHGGGIIKVDSYYYWFGENRNSNGSFRYVSCYRSTDLKNWEFRNHVLTQNSASELSSANIERPKVIYNSSTKQYVMWMHKESSSDYGQARAAVATSSTVDGNYSYRGSFRPLNYMSRDITLFRDDDGTGYMISAANENADLHVYRLSADYLTVSSRVQLLWAGQKREAPALFKRNGVYFLLTSGCTGWSPNQQKYATATSITGTWSSLQNVGNGTMYDSQTTFVLPIQGSQTTSYLYLGDRWAGAWSGPVNDSQYVWLPIQFPTTTTMTISWATNVSIDTATGAVSGSTLTDDPMVNLVARHSGKCVAVESSSTADHAAVIQQACGSGTNQQWQLQDAGSGYYRIVARHSGKCLDVTSGSTEDRAAIIQWSCGSGTNQQFSLQDAGSGYYRIVARHSGKCLDVTSGSTADGATIMQYTCGSGTNQQWSRRAV